jgi:mannose-6-phosphate isomerase-like protein (cupin superfamily)
MLQRRVIDVMQAAQKNSDFRHVLFTGTHSQLVLMALRPTEEIGMEVHGNVDQLLYVVQGRGVAATGNATEALAEGDVFCVPAGTTHNVVNTGAEPLKLFTVHSPPQHAAETVHHAKADADAAERNEGPVAAA